MKSLPVLVLLLFSFQVYCNDNDTDPSLSGSEAAAKIQFLKKIPSTPVRDQYKTSTCWSFSGISLIESELIRQGKGEYDLSEMFIVRHTYERKAERYVRMHGKTNFAPGGETNDVTTVFDSFGIVPEEAYTGLKPNEEKHRHGEMDKVLEKYVEALVADKDKELSLVWKDGFNHVLDSYLGEIPDSFRYKGEKYTSKTFAEHLDIDPSDYVMITSFTHAPYYEPVVLEIPDNWSWASSYNVPLDVFTEIVDSAIFKGYSVAWAADVSETGFDFNTGYAVAPKLCYAPETHREVVQWNKKSEEEKKEIMFSFSKPVEEVEVTPEFRQEAFDNFTTTDDHGMHILGIARDKNGRTFYYVKNSWGTDNPYDGYFFVSRPYFQYKTVLIMLNRVALPRYVQNALSL